MKKITDSITKWWQNVDRQMLFWQVLAVILVTWSIIKGA